MGKPSLIPDKRRKITKSKALLLLETIDRILSSHDVDEYMGDLDKHRLREAYVAASKLYDAAPHHHRSR